MDPDFEENFHIFGEFECEPEYYDESSEEEEEFRSTEDIAEHNDNETQDTELEDVEDNDNHNVEDDDSVEENSNCEEDVSESEENKSDFAQAKETVVNFSEKNAFSFDISDFADELKSIVTEELKKVFFDALEANNVELIEEIIQHHPDLVNDSYFYHGHFIFTVVRCCDLHIFQKFMGAGCDLKVRQGDGRNILHRAVYYEKLDIIKYILDFCRFDINETNRYNDTAAHDACYFGKLESLKVLLQYSPDVSILNEQGRNCLEVANIALYLSDTKRECADLLQQYMVEKESMKDYEEIRQAERKLIQIKLEVRLKNKQKKLAEMEDISEKKSKIEAKIEEYKTEIGEIQSKIKTSEVELEKIVEELEQYSVLEKEVSDLRWKVLAVKSEIHCSNPKFPTDISKNNSLVDDTDCPICCCSLKPPTKIYQCSEGHYFCEKCKRNYAMKNCPSCRENLLGKDIRCRVLENLMAKRFEDLAYI